MDKMIKETFHFALNMKMKFILLLLLSGVGVIIAYFQPLLTRRIIDDGLNNREYSKVIYFAGIILAATLFQQISEVIQARNYCKIKNQFIQYLYKIILNKLVKIDLNCLDKTNSASISNTLTNDISNVSLIFDRSTLIVFNYGIITLGGIIGLAYIDWYLTLIVLLFIPVKLIYIIKFTRRLEEINTDLIKDSVQFYEWWGENIEGIKEIKWWRLFDRRNSLLEEKQKLILNKQYSATMIDCYNMACDNILECGVRILIYGYAGYLVCNAQLSVGALLAFITYTEYIIRPISVVLYVKFIIAKIKPSIIHLSNFLESPEEINYGKLEVGDFERLEFKNVSFSFDQKDVLKNCDFLVNRGEKVAIIGHNGSGKSTLVRLILREIVPKSGKILLNERNVSDYDINDYRDTFSISSQTFFLFKDSLRNNFDLKHELNDDDIIDRSHIYIELNKSIMNKMITTNGKNLSGGERQNVALIRALCKNGEVFLLDESDANLDKEFLHKLDIMLKNLKEKTVIFITHRKSDFENMDAVYHLENSCLKRIK